MIIFLAYFNVQSIAVDSQFYSNLRWTLYNFYPRGTPHLKDNMQMLALWFWNLTAWQSSIVTWVIMIDLRPSVHCRGLKSWGVGLPLEMFCCPVLRFISKVDHFSKTKLTQINHWPKNAHNVGKHNSEFWGAFFE